MRMRIPVMLVMLVALGTLAPASVWAQPPQGQGRGRGQAADPNEVTYPAQVTSRFEGGCAICHDNPNAVSHAPSREQLRALTPERIVEGLTKPIAAHEGRVTMTDSQKRAIAELATGKQFSGTPARDVSVMTNKCPAPLKMDNPFAKPHWNGWSPDPTTNNRFVPADQAKLTAEQVPQLKLKWAFAFPDAASVAWSQPVIVGGVVFMGTDNNYVYALDAKSGCAYWAYNAKAQVRAAVSIEELKETPGVRYAAYFGDMTGMVHAVNAETGQALWSMRADPHPGSKITAAIVIDPKDGKLIVPVASWEEQTGSQVDYECCKFQGSVVAVNPKSGKQVWKTYAFNERPYSLGKKNTAGRDLYGPAGAGIWSSMAVDSKNRVVYAGLGNCYISEHFTRPDFDGGACDAVQAISVDTGKKLWTTQLLSTGLDRDEGGCGRGPERRINCPGYIQGPGDDVSQTTLITLPTGKRVVLGNQESGRITAMDPDNKGAKLWVTQAGDSLSPNGAAFGGAFDGDLFYRPLPFTDQSGALAAIKVTTGERVWYTKLPKPADCADPNSRLTCNSGNWAAATAIPGAVFTGSRDGVLRAYSSKDGKIIWEFPTNKPFDTINGVKGKGGGIGASSPTVLDGMVYMGSGYAILGGSPGNVLLAFGTQ
jgi:polyvinyl alcohol dehydrogenase (cytochrome)